MISGLTKEDFADLYSQTITYGLFAARTRTENGFNRKLAYDRIPKTIGILKDIFKFISLGDLPEQMEWIIDDISEVLATTDVYKLLDEYFNKHKGKDPIVHFYETFLAEYDPKTREKRGVYYTPEPVVSYIVRSIHYILKEYFDKNDGFASQSVTVLDPAAGTLTFLAEAAHLAVEEFTKKYGEGKRMPDEMIRLTYNLNDKANWKLKDAREEIIKDDDWDQSITKILYRPFDEQWIFYHDAVIERSRKEVMQHMIKENLGLLTCRQQNTTGFYHAFVSDTIVESCIVSNQTREISYLFPLYLYQQKDKPKKKPLRSIMLLFEPQAEYGVRKPNLSPIIIEKLTKAYRKEPSPENIFYYIYAVLYSNIYRTKYAEFLKIDFPRIPFTKDYKLFKKMSDYGERLIELHLLKSSAIDTPIARFRGEGNDKVEKLRYEKRKLYINNDQYFEGIPLEV